MAIVSKRSRTAALSGTKPCQAGNPRCSNCLHVRGAIIMLLIVTMLNAMAADSSAVVIFLKNSDEPIVGYLIREDGATVRIDQVQDGGDQTPRTVARSEIANIIYTVSNQRLETLHYKEPQEYRRYAEELAPKRQDPEARDTAIRLYVIAAHLDPDNLGRSCMLGLINLAQSEQEERSFRAMAYSLDPDHDEQLLRQPNVPQANSDSMDDDVRLRLLSAIRLLRQDRRHSARQAMNHAAVQGLLAGFQEVLTLTDFEEACTGSHLSASMLEKLVKLELALLPRAGAADRTKNGEKNSYWHQAVLRDGLAPVPTLTLQRLTRFDPTRCHFRDGEWVEPED